MKLILLILPMLVLSACVVVPVSSYKSGGGTALVCHKGKKTLELPRSAAQAHLDHGDRYGRC